MRRGDYAFIGRSASPRFTISLEELKALGVEDIKIQVIPIVTATLPSNLDYEVPTVAFFGHLDTSAEQTNDTKAQILPYKGGDLCLNKELGDFLRQSEFPELEKLYW